MASASPEKRSVLRGRLSRKLTPYAFVLPAMIVLLAFKVGPVLVSMYGSLFKTGAKNTTFFVGLKNRSEEHTSELQSP